MTTATAFNASRRTLVYTFMRLASLALVLSLFLPGPVVASEPPVPPRRAHHSLVYDENRKVVLLTAGSTPLDNGQRFQFFNDLWAFDECGWRLLGESGEPLSGIGLAFDPVKNRLISFGGYKGQSLGVLRRLDADQWQTLDTLAEMSVAEPGFVYDAARKRFVMFGGSAGRGRAKAETWEYDGTDWTQVAVTGPPPRQSHVMVFDGRRGRTVVFGGMGVPAAQGQQPPSLGDTWEFDGTTWSRHDGPAPSPRHAAGAAYDSRRGVVLLFGGAGPDGFKGDTWSWNGTEWKKLSEKGPEARAMGTLAYDIHRDRVVMFGGRKGWPDGDLNDTWEWNGKAWKVAAPEDCEKK